jgi:hypothetical protein
MKLAKMAVLTGFGCVCLLTIIRPDSGAAQHPEAVQRVGLFDAHRSVLFNNLRAFIYTKGIKIPSGFVSLVDSGEQSPVFAKTPDGWGTWDDDEKYKHRVIYHDADGFRMFIFLTLVKRVEEELVDHIRLGQRYGSIVVLDQVFISPQHEVARVAKCEKLKGNVDFSEYRYFEGEKHTLCVELSVSDTSYSDRTVADLRKYLQSHYGKYEAVCQQVGSIVFRAK